MPAEAREGPSSGARSPAPVHPNYARYTQLLPFGRLLAVVAALVPPRTETAVAMHVKKHGLSQVGFAS